jgi:hypothetical protein
MARWIAIFCACLVVAIATCWAWAHVGRHRVQVMRFGESRCVCAEVRPWGYLLSVSTYDRGFPVGFNQPKGPDWVVRSTRADERVRYIAAEFQKFGFDYGSYARDSYYGGPTRFATVPYWAAEALPAALGAGAARRAMTLRRRRREGMCPSCGYDLRATPDRCPECGRTPTAPVTPPVTPPVTAPVSAPIAGPSA